MPHLYRWVEPDVGCSLYIPFATWKRARAAMEHGKTIPGVPETIRRSDYLALMESLGLDLEDLKMLEFRRDGIYATVMARNAEGRHTADPVTRETNVHRIYIPVVDDTPGE